MIPKRRAGPFIFYINALPLFYINWSVHVPVEISVLFVTVLWKIFSTYTSISFFFGGGGGTISLLTVTILLHIESLKCFNALFPPPKLYYLLNKELLLAIKRRFEYLSLGMSVFNKHCISLPVFKSKDIMFLSYSNTSLKSVKPISFLLFWLLIYFFKNINNWIYASF